MYRYLAWFYRNLACVVYRYMVFIVVYVCKHIVCVISVFIEQNEKNQPLNTVNDGEQKRDFVHVTDIVQANILCAESKNKINGEIFNVGTGKAFTVNEIADMFGGDKKYGELRVEPKDSIAENAKIILDLDWSPTGNLNNWITKTLKNEY